MTAESCYAREPGAHRGRPEDIEDDRLIPIRLCMPFHYSVIPT